MGWGPGGSVCRQYPTNSLAHSKFSSQWPPSRLLPSLPRPPLSLALHFSISPTIRPYTLRDTLPREQRIGWGRRVSISTALLCHAPPRSSSGGSSKLRRQTTTTRVWARFHKRQRYSQISEIFPQCKGLKVYMTYCVYVESQLRFKIGR